MFFISSIFIETLF